MHIKRIIRQHRRDFKAIYECEHCEHTYEDIGYDDANFHNNVIPTMTCPVCGKRAGASYRPLCPKYSEETII